MTICSVVFGSDKFAEWSPMHAIQMNAYTAAHYLFYWNLHDNGTMTEDLWNQYALQWNIPTVILGVSSMLLNYAGWLWDHMQKDIIFLAVLGLKQGMTALECVIQENSDDLNPNSSFDYKWEQYQLFKKLANMMNSTYAVMISLLHANVILQLSYFLLDLLEPEYMTLMWYFLIFDVVKAFLIYYQAMEVSSQVRINLINTYLLILLSST